MCGIVGAFQRSGPAWDPAVLRRACDVIAYRGPDAAGEFIDGPVALGIRRLSIIDLAGGRQPITSPDGRYTIVFNGEIYNYRELRGRLEGSYPFQTQSDTEVLLAHLIRHGPDGLRDLNGMFAFAFWDREQEALLLARDRVGKKPLYYADTGGAFVAASELKSVLAFPNIPRSLDREAVARYFFFEYVPSPATPFTAIRKLPPGHWMRVTRAGVTLKRWWQPYPPEAVTLPHASPAQNLDAVLDAAVCARMVADVPVGVLLSGGIDSTTIAWYMRQHTKALHSFSVSIDDPTFDESAYAWQAARALGTTHHDISFSLDAFREALTVAQERLDEPLGDASLLPTYTVSREAKRFVTVVLDGDGADELFLGYNTFPAATIAAWADRLPKSLVRLAGRIAERLPTSHTYFSVDFKIKMLLRGLPFQGAVRNQVWIGSFHPFELDTLLQPDWRVSPATLTEPITTLEEQLRGLSPLERLSVTYLLQYLAEDILAKIDRATMYASVEARTPFLDPRVISLALQLPLHERFRNFRGKRLLAEVMRGRIPEEIRRRPKRGFGIPIGRWFRGPLRPLLTETLRADRVAATGVLRPETVQQLVAEHLDGRADHRKKLWTLMVFIWWYERWARQ